jgi:nicotinamide-nucleotide amidase
MAIGVRRRTGATWAISVTGNAGPTTDGDNAPVGMVHVGISGPSETVSFHRHWPTSDRARVRAFASQMALDLLNRKLSH